MHLERDELRDLGQSSERAQIARGMALAREVNDGLRALFLPQHGRRPWVGRRWWFICPRTGGERKIVSADRRAFTFAPELRLRRRTIGGVGVQVSPSCSCPTLHDT